MSWIDEAIVCGVIVLICIVCGAAINTILSGGSSTPEYKEGHLLGATEHNATKYYAAIDICNSFGVGYTKDQFNYACGYYEGYLVYVDDEESKAADNKRNETARILGV